jgi:hypothetical protein
MSKSVYTIVTYIKANELFNLDTMDLLCDHMDACDILSHLGIDMGFNESEKSLFMKQMGKLARQNQTAEIIRSIFSF